MHDAVETGTPQEPPPSRPHAPQRPGTPVAGLRVLAYCTEWDPHKGGIIAVNRNLVEALAAAGHEVFVRVGHEVASADAGERVHLIGPRHYDPNRLEQEQLAYDGEALPSDVDVIIGHSRYSGPDALAVRDALYPNTPLVHVVHMVTGSLARVAHRPDLEVEFEGIERRMIAAADLVTGVGPVLEAEARRLASTNPGDHVPKIHRIDPGAPFEEPRPLPWDGQRTRNVLFMGRADTPQKGGHHAAQMIGNLIDEGIDVRLTVRGALPEHAENTEQRLSQIVGRAVEVKPFTIDRDEILADMRQADVLVMPSRAEGFGLVGLDAAGAGLPVLVPSKSGMGEFLGDPNRFPHELTRRNLVEQSFEDDANVGLWTAAVRDILIDIPSAQQNALALQQLLREADTTWSQAAEALAAATAELPDRSAPHPQPPELPEIAGDGWTHCAQGHSHHGRFGAAGLLPVYRATDGELRVLLRSDTDGSRDKGWEPFGGPRSSHESAAESALRFAADEGGLDPGGFQVERVVREDHGGWSYDTVIASVEQPDAIRPADRTSGTAAWVSLAEVADLDLDPDFAACWTNVQDKLAAEIGDDPLAPGTAATATQGGAPSLPAHPVTRARVVGRDALSLGGGTVNRELATFDDGTRAVYERYERPEDAEAKVLDTYVARAVSARIPLAYPVGHHEVYTDRMPRETVSTRHQESQSAVASYHVPETPDAVLLGLHHTLTANQGAIVGEQEDMVWVGSGAAPRGQSPDTANPYVGFFYRETDEQSSSWVDNPLLATETPIVRQRLDSLRPLFASYRRLDLHDKVIERFGRIAEHATGTTPMLPNAPSQRRTTAPERHLAPPPLPRSRELTEHQQAAEALMTANGRITDMSDAKKFAIEAVARRMRASTPALVLAALGDVIGTDVDNRLGDKRYVLALHNEGYPSLGADVLHVGELDPRNTLHAPDKIIPMDSAQADILVREICVSELVKAWAFGSNNNTRSLALQEAAMEEFDLSGTLEWQLDQRAQREMKQELAYNGETLRHFLRVQYQITQETLAAHGISEVVAYRAMTWTPGAAQPDWNSMAAGDAVEMLHRPLASWTVDREVAADRLERRGGRGMILAARKPAEDVLATPLTGIGALPQREWVTLPDAGSVTLDSVYADGIALNRAKERVGVVTLGNPALDSATPEPASTEQGTGRAWQPAVIRPSQESGNPLDDRIKRVLDGRGEAPNWWPRDDSGYAVTKRDLEFLEIDPVQLRWLLTGEAPMGMTPESYSRFGTEMLVAMGRDGAMPSQVDVRLKGTGSAFFGGLHKTLPKESELADQPAVLRRMQEWFGDSRDRPLRRLYDSMWRLGIESEPSDVDLDINSTALVRMARDHWNTHHPEQYPGDFRTGHGYLYKKTVSETFPELSDWARKWEYELGRPLSLGVFESSGPVDSSVLGRQLSAHKRSADWVIHAPDCPMAWLTPERNSRGATLGLSAPSSPVSLAQRANPRKGRVGPSQADRTDSASHSTRPPTQELHRRGSTPER